MRPGWLDCPGPVRDEYGVCCRWDDREPDCDACRAAGMQAEMDAADYYYDLESEVRP